LIQISRTDNHIPARVHNSYLSQSIRDSQQTIDI
jgi:hypothetical protein